MYEMKFYDSNNYKKGVFSSPCRHNLYVISDAETGRILTALQAVSKADACRLYADRVKTFLSAFGIPAENIRLHVTIERAEVTG